MTADTAQRASSFGSVAEAYDRYRPGPPRAALEWILRSPVGTAADLGAGTGALTRELAARAARVIALEPDPRMLAVLKRRSPRVAAARCPAEDLPLGPGPLDAVTVSSAWHWMDPDRTVAELGRVLRPGGVLGVIWNGADRSVGWVTELLGTRDPSPGDRNRWSRHRFELPSGAPFDHPDSDVIRWALSMTREELVGLAGTYSSMITMPPDRREQETARVRAAVGAVMTGDRIEVPMSCRCWRAVRR